MHHVVHAATLPEAYHRAICILNGYGEKRPCPAYNTMERSVSITIDIARPLEEPMISKLIPCDPTSLQQYLMEMEEGIMDFEARETGNWPYTYHDRMIEQLIGAVNILKKDPNSRRAVVLIRREDDFKLDDPPCLQMIQYLINPDGLDCYVTFRSNDAVKAFFMNAFALIDIQRIVAGILDVPVNRYVHTANSFHAYRNDWDKLENFTQRIFNAQKEGKLENLAMNYTGDLGWKELMDEEVPGIFEKVSVQMKKHNIKHHGYYIGELDGVIRRELSV